MKTSSSHWKFAANMYPSWIFEQWTAEHSVLMSYVSQWSFSSDSRIKKSRELRGLKYDNIFSYSFHDSFIEVKNWTFLPSRKLLYYAQINMFNFINFCVLFWKRDWKQNGQLYFELFFTVIKNFTEILIIYWRVTFFQLVSLLNAQEMKLCYSCYPVYSRRLRSPSSVKQEHVVDWANN